MRAGGRLVVVGAGLAGFRAVETARREGHAGELVLLGAEERAPYDRPPLSKAALAPGATEPVPFRTAEELEDDLGVDLRLGEEATGLDTAAREVVLGGERLAYDALVVATGARPRAVPGDHLAGVTHLRTADDAAVVRRALDAGARTVVVGAGFIGSEVASAARARGLEVTVVEAADVPLQRSLGPEVGRLVTRLHRDAGVDLRLGSGVTGLTEVAGHVTGLALEDGTELAADLVVLGVGVAPSTGWLEGSGVDLHPRDRGVVCDDTLATNAPGVWAAGDVVHAPHPLLGGDLLRVEHWTSAAEQGAAAARHALDPASAQPFAPVPYVWSDLFGHRLQLVGTSVADGVVVLDADDGGVAGTTALWHRGGQVVGALVVDRPRVVMKLRRRIADGGPFDEALHAARELLGRAGT